MKLRKRFLIKIPTSGKPTHILMRDNHIYSQFFYINRRHIEPKWTKRDFDRAYDQSEPNWTEPQTCLACQNQALTVGSRHWYCTVFMGFRKITIRDCLCLMWQSKRPCQRIRVRLIKYLIWRDSHRPTAFIWLFWLAVAYSISSLVLCSSAY